jgi:hypothetical protein
MRVENTKKIESGKTRVYAQKMPFKNFISVCSWEAAAKCIFHRTPAMVFASFFTRKKHLVRMIDT